MQLGWDAALVATTLGVSEPSLKRWQAQYEANGGPFALGYSLSGWRRSLAVQIPEICELLKEDPTLYLNKYVDWIFLTHGIIVSWSTALLHFSKTGK